MLFQMLPTIRRGILDLCRLLEVNLWNSVNLGRIACVFERPGHRTRAVQYACLFRPEYIHARPSPNRIPR